MPRLVRDLQLVDARGRKYLATDEHQRFLEAAARAPRPANQIFALTLTYTRARISEALAIRPVDVNLEVASVPIRTLKRCAEHWREIPVPPEFVHALRSAPANAVSKPLWPWSRAIAHRRITGIMSNAGIEGLQACPKGLRHGFGIAAVADDDRCRPGPRQPADHRGLHHRHGPRGAGLSGQNMEKDADSAGSGA